MVVKRAFKKRAEDDVSPRQELKQAVQDAHDLQEADVTRSPSPRKRVRHMFVVLASVYHDSFAHLISDVQCIRRQRARVSAAVFAESTQ